MPQYVIEREIPGAGNLSDAELQAVARKSVGVLKELGPEIKWLHSYVTGVKVYCVYLAPDEETVREHARRGGFPANRMSAVRRLIDPNTANCFKLSLEAEDPLPRRHSALHGQLVRPAAPSLPSTPSAPQHVQGIGAQIPELSPA